VYRLHGYVGYHIDLEFAADETFTGLAAGDIDALAFTAQGNHLFLKPRATRVATNLTILTDRRHYQIDYTASTEHPDPELDEVIYALRFRYPEPPPKSPDATPANAKAEPLRVINRDYGFCGHRLLKPLAVSDDGVHTRIRFSPKSEFPALFVRNDDGSESLLNFHIESDEVVIHRVARRLILRRGSLIACIVNQGFGRGGEP
jgi:type IV secretion system protein VirB9